MATMHRYWRVVLDALLMATVAATLLGLEIASAGDGGGL